MHSDTYLPIGCRSHIAMQYGMESDSNPFCSGAKEFDLLGCQVLISKYSSKVFMPMPLEELRWIPPPLSNRRRKC